MLDLQSITLVNFRAFEYLELDLHPELTVLIGSNGLGKSSILDAVAVALGPFVGAFDLGASRSFKPSDIRLEQVRQSYLPEMEYVQGGVEVRASGHVPVVSDECATSAEAFEWKRCLSAPTGARTTTADSRVLEVSANSLQECMKRRGAEVTVPVVAYYGPGRLYKVKNKSRRKASATSRTAGYIDCLESDSSYEQLSVWLQTWFLAQREARDRHDDAASAEIGAYLHSVLRTIRVCLEPVGWTDLEYSLASEELIATKEGVGALPVSMLSDGIRGMISLVADIAFRCTKLNPHLGAHASRDTPGIVLIDEIDLHLHPAWQQSVVSSLREAFPAVQFIMTTHSPQVLSDVPSECIRQILTLVDEDDGKVRYYAQVPSIETQGASSSTALSAVMSVNPEPDNEFTRNLTQLHQLTQGDQASTLQAEALYEKLLRHFGPTHPQIVLLDAERRRRERKRRLDATLER